MTINIDDLPDEVLTNILNVMGIDEEDELQAQHGYSAVERMTPEEAFAFFLQWEGIIGYGSKITRALDGIRAASKQKPTLAVVMDGGLVQAIVSDDPNAIDLADLIVIDYDTKSSDKKDLVEVPQGDGTVIEASVIHLSVTKAAIDLGSLSYEENEA